MAPQSVLNIILATTWMFLSGGYAFSNFLLGFLIGIGLAYLFKKVLPGSFYLKRVYKVIKLIVVFFIELMKTNIDVSKIVLQPRLRNQPGFFIYHTDLEHGWQIVLLSSLITLTPGTVVLGTSDDRAKIYIHSIGFSTEEEEVESAKSSSEKVVREVDEA